MKTSRLFSEPSKLALALMCAVGFGIATDIAFAQTPSTTRRGGGTTGGSTAGTSGQGSGDWYGVEQRGYLPSELDKPIEEFFVGQTAYTQPAGSFMVTLGGAMELGSEGVDMTGLLARGEYGITNNFEVHAAVPVAMSQKPGTGTSANTASIDPTFERISLGAAYAITPMNNPIAMSAAVDVDVPIASGGQVVIKPSLIGAYDFGPTEFHADVQAELGDVARGLNFNAGIAHSLGEFVPTLELNTQATEGARPLMHATPGLYYNFSNRMELGVGVPIGLNDVSETGVMAKFSMAFGR